MRVPRHHSIDPSQIVKAKSLKINDLAFFIPSRTVPFRPAIDSFLTRFFGAVKREGQASLAGTPDHSVREAG